MEIKHELQPILNHVEKISNDNSISGVDDIFQEIREIISGADSVFAAKKSCRNIEAMCHPKAWGDRFVQGLSLKEWWQWLDKLRRKCVKCHNKIVKKYEQ